MILLVPRNVDPRGGDMFAVFGVGLIGSSVVEALARSGAYRASAVQISWDDQLARREQLERLEGRLAAELPRVRAGAELCRLGIVWSAGRAGFGASTVEVDRELESFRDVLALAGRVAWRLPFTTVTFGLISSAGGLFEGQRSVSAASRPAPRRPYGIAKMQQERLLAEADEPLGRRIYRLTSVYGHLVPGWRTGLASALILNGVRRKVTHITGRMDTLRDFVWADDVGRFVACDLRAGSRVRVVPPRLLASARPSSIHEVQKIVERVLGRRIYVSFGSGEANSENITFSPRSVADGWESSDLPTNAREIYLRALSSGAAFGLPAA